jgi:hypothetical protein
VAKLVRNRFPSPFKSLIKSICDWPESLLRKKYPYCANRGREVEITACHHFEGSHLGNRLGWGPLSTLGMIQQLEIAGCP